MEKAVTKEYSCLNDAYLSILTAVLDNELQLTDKDIDNIKSRLYENMSKIKTKNSNDNLLQNGSTEIVNRAKDNKIKKFAFNTSQSQTNRRYNFAIEDTCTVISGMDNTRVLSEISSWLCDFGDCYNKFDISMWGCHPKMAEGLDLVREVLKVSSLMPDILRKPLSRGNIWEPENICNATWRAACYVQVQPIQVEFWFHEPSSVKEDVKIDEVKQTITVNGEKLHVSIPHIDTSKNLVVEFDGELEYTVKKGVYGRKLWKVCTFGILRLFDSEKSIKFVHKVKMKMKCKAEKIKQRDEIEVKIRREDADKFMKVLQEYESVENPEHKKTRELVAIMETKVLVDWGVQWRKCIRLMRVGGKDAIIEMVAKKPLVIENLPKDINNLAGVAFEELQIQDILEEATRRNVTLKHIAGDGRGEFVFNGKTCKTPEYVDAVFHNESIEKMYAVQFKYADTSENLKSMRKHWIDTHTNSQPPPGTVPEELLLKNVQLVGPKDVVDQLDLSGGFTKKIDVGFKHSPLKTEDVKSFLSTFDAVLKAIVLDKSVKNLRKMKTAIKREEKQLKKKLRKVQTLGNTRTNKKYKRRVKICEERYRLNLKEVQTAEKKYHNLIRKQMSKGVCISAFKQIGHSALSGGITDGFMSFLIARDTEKKFLNIAKKTKDGFIRGGAISIALSAPGIAGTLAGYAGYPYAEAVLSTVGKLAGPALIIGMVGYSIYTVYNKFKDGDITSAEAKKAIGRLSISTGVSVTGMIIAGSLIGGPLGLAVGTGIAIAVGTGDYYLGDKLASLFVKDDPDEKKALLKRKQKEKFDEVLDAAYKLFDSSEHESDDELHAIFRRALLTYHPDKNVQDENKKENAEIIKAIIQAKSFIIPERAK